MAWTASASGTQTATINTEHTLTSPTAVGTYVFSVDNESVMALGDTLILRAYKKIDATNFAPLFEFTYQHVQATSVIFPAISLASSFGLSFTLQQTAGTGRAYPWLVEVI